MSVSVVCMCVISHVIRKGKLYSCMHVSCGTAGDNKGSLDEDVYGEQ